MRELGTIGKRRSLDLKQYRTRGKVNFCERVFSAFRALLARPLPKHFDYPRTLSAESKTRPTSPSSKHGSTGSSILIFEGATGTHPRISELVKQSEVEKLT
jgi:hypothetical protein